MSLTSFAKLSPHTLYIVKCIYYYGTYHIGMCIDHKDLYIIIIDVYKSFFCENQGFTFQ